MVSLRKKIPAKEFSPSSSTKETKEKPNTKTLKAEIDKEELQESLKQVTNSKRAYFFDNELNILKKVPTTQAARELTYVNNVTVVAIDGKTTSAIVRAAQNSGVKIIAAKNFSSTNEEGIEFVSF